jgi:uncharacterized protein
VRARSERNGALTQPVSFSAPREKTAMRFKWDPRKAESNIGKHGLSFEEASTAFGDPLSRTTPDLLHSSDEDRLILMGMTSAGRLAVVAHADRGETVRLISARLATAGERRRYEQSRKE